MLVEPEYYEVLPDFMEGREEWLDFEKHEEDMWKKGYIKAYKDIYSSGMSIEKDEYFKVIYDDCDNNIFIEKENGVSGWVTIDYDTQTWNDGFFFLAG